MSEHRPKKPHNPETDSPLLEAQQLSCSLGGETVISGLELRLNKGEVLGLVGLNGAGKSTTLRMLCGLLNPDTGEVRIGGLSLQHQPIEARRLLGYLPDPPALHGCLSVVEAVHIAARLHGIDKHARGSAVDKALERCQLDAVRHKRISSLSKGFKQRTGLALALVHQPKLLILDEPASGLDPRQREHLNQLIQSLADDTAIIFSSHSIADVQSCCTRVALLQAGTLIHERQAQHSGSTWHYKLELREAIDATALQALPGVRTLQAVDATTWHVQIDNDDPDPLLSAALRHGWGLLSLSRQDTAMQALLNTLHQDSNTPEAA